MKGILGIVVLFAETIKWYFTFADVECRSIQLGGLVGFNN